MFTDWTSSIFEESKLPPLDWLLVIGFWQLKLNATAISAAADNQETQTPGGINLIRPANWSTKWKRMSATKVRAAKGGLVKSNVTTAHPDNAGCSFAVALPPRWAVPPCWAWCNAATRQTRTPPPRKSISKC